MISLKSVSQKTDGVRAVVPVGDVDVHVPVQTKRVLAQPQETFHRVRQPLHKLVKCAGIARPLDHAQRQW